MSIGRINLLFTEPGTRNKITVICSIFPGAFLGVTWGFRGGFEGRTSLNPQEIPNKVSPIPHYS